MEMGRDPNETGGREPKAELYSQQGWIKLLLFYLPLHPEGLAWRDAQ